MVGGLIGLSELVVTYGQRSLLRVCLHAMICLQVFFLSSRSVTVAMLTGGWVPALALVIGAGLVLHLARRWDPT